VSEQVPLHHSDARGMKVDVEVAEAWALAQHEQHVVTDQAPRCWRCRRKLANHVSRPWELICERCHAINAAPLTG
jgi:hypothetical protein